jgi:hypothetical protein
VKTYAATHTGPETLEYAETLIYEMTENEFDDGSGVGGLFPPATFGGEINYFGTGEERRRWSRDQKEAAGMNTMRRYLSQPPCLRERSLAAGLYRWGQE